MKDHLIKLINQGLSQRKIAEELNVTRGKVTWLLQKYNLKTKHIASKNKYLELDDNIKEKVIKNNKKIYAKEFRKNQKIKLMNELGGSCLICGYDKCIDALEFHHLDSSEKEFGLSTNNLLKKMDVLLKELNKCILVCSNCHREIHAGLYPEYLK